MMERADIPLDDPAAKLELRLIEEYLAQQGRSRAELSSLPDAVRLKLLRDAEIYASGRMAEIEARAHYVEDLHRHE
jgi:hypothetical protein